MKHKIFHQMRSLQTPKETASAISEEAANLLNLLLGTSEESKEFWANTIHPYVNINNFLFQSIHSLLLCRNLKSRFAFDIPVNPSSIKKIPLMNRVCKLTGLNVGKAIDEAIFEQKSPFQKDDIQHIAVTQQTTGILFAILAKKHSIVANIGSRSVPEQKKCIASKFLGRIGR